MQVSARESKKSVEAVDSQMRRTSPLIRRACKNVQEGASQCKRVQESASECKRVQETRRKALKPLIPRCAAHLHSSAEHARMSKKVQVNARESKRVQVNAREEERSEGQRR